MTQPDHASTSSFYQSSRQCRAQVLAFLLLAMSLFGHVTAYGQAVTITVTVGGNPIAVGLNPATNKIYVPNSQGGISVINGATGALITTVTDTSGTAYSPNGVAVNPTTNMIYVTNSGGGTNNGNMTVINGINDTYFTTLSDLGSNGASQPGAIAVNPVTNKIYVANRGSANVSEFDGATNTYIATIAVGTSPESIAINSVTNTIYVANHSSNNVTVINGMTNAPATVTDTNANAPETVAVNPVTNTAYVGNFGSGNITVIVGSTHTTTISDPNGITGIASVAVNPVTNQVFTANYSGNVSVFSGTTWVVTIATPSLENSIAIDTVSNTVYAASQPASGNGSVTLINGNTLGVIANLTAGNGTQDVAANPITHKAYAANSSGTVTVIDGTTYEASSGTTEANSLAIAVNPVTDTVYVANNGASTVSVINGATNAVSAVLNTAPNPYAITVNPATNMIYVANQDVNAQNSSDLTVIDGGSNTVTYQAVDLYPGVNPVSISVDPVTNQIYVFSSTEDAATPTEPTLSLIDGGNPSANVAFATPNCACSDNESPVAVAVDPVTNQIYTLLSVSGGNAVAVFDGGFAFNFSTYAIFLPSYPGQSPTGIAVNPVTNFIYVSESSDNTSQNGGLSAIAGGTLTPPFISPSANPSIPAFVSSTNSPTASPAAVAVNPISNMVYVANQITNNVSVFSGAIGSTPAAFVADVSVGTKPVALAVNQVTNKIYVLNQGSNSITVIDGTSNTAVATISQGAGTFTPTALAINPVTNQVEIANAAVDSTTAITEDINNSNAITTAITPMTGNPTAVENPTFNFSAQNTFTNDGINNLYYQVDSWQGTWIAANNLGSGNFSATLSPLQPGFHFIYAYATDGEDANSSSISALQSSPLIGTIASYGFLVAPPIAFAAPTVSYGADTLNFGNVQVNGGSISEEVVLANEGGSPLTFSVQITGPGAGQFTLPNTNLGNPENCDLERGTLNPTSFVDGNNPCWIYVGFTPTEAGPTTATLVITDNSYGVSGEQQIVNLTGTGSYLVTVTPSGTGAGSISSDPGGISCFWNAGRNPHQGGVCLSEFAPDMITLTASPAGNSTFGGWGGACSGTGTCVLDVSNANDSVTATFDAAASTYTLSVTEAGTGQGVVTDNLSKITCGENNGIPNSGNTCSASYAAGTMVTLTATATAPSSFAGWGGACVPSVVSGNTCTLTINSAQSATANFIPGPVSQTFTFPMGTNPSVAATFACPSNTNPCTDPNAHALQLQVPSVSASFPITITATEVPPTQFDGICESNMDNAGAVADFDCRFLNFFPYGIDPTTGGTIVPFCYPYANGNCVHYDVYSGTPGNEPDTNSYTGPVSWLITWNDDTIPAPGPYWNGAGNIPQLYDDPDYAPTPTSAVGTSCSSVMTINGVGQSYYCQFEFNITTSYNEGQEVDSGIGGNTKQFNDVVVAWPPTVEGGQLSSSSSPDASTAEAGSTIGFTITVTNQGPGTENNVTLNDPLPPGATWSINTNPSLGTCSITGPVGSQVLSCMFGDLALAANTSLHVSGASAAAGTYANSTTITGTITVNNAQVVNQQFLTNATVTVQALASVFSGLTASQAITYGTASILLSGTISASGPMSGTLYPPSGEVISVAINNSTQNTMIVGSSGGFSLSFPTLAIPASTTPYTITYSYRGDSDFALATNSATTLTLNKANQIITFTTPPPATAVYNSAFNVAATSASGLAVTITASGACTIANNKTVTITSGTGSCTLAGNQSGQFQLQCRSDGHSDCNHRGEGRQYHIDYFQHAQSIDHWPAGFNRGDGYREWHSDWQRSRRREHGRELHRDRAQFRRGKLLDYIHDHWIQNGHRGLFRRQQFQHEYFVERFTNREQRTHTEDLAHECELRDRILRASRRSIRHADKFRNFIDNHLEHPCHNAGKRRRRLRRDHQLHAVYFENAGNAGGRKELHDCRGIPGFRENLQPDGINSVHRNYGQRDGKPTDRAAQPNGHQSSGEFERYEPQLR